MDGPDLGFWLRISTASLYLLVGVGIAVAKPRNRGKLAAGVALVFVGAALIVRNLEDSFGGRMVDNGGNGGGVWTLENTMGSAALYVLAGVAVLAAAVRFPDRELLKSRRFLLLAATVLLYGVIRAVARGLNADGVLADATYTSALATWTWSLVSAANDVFNLAIMLFVAAVGERLYAGAQRGWALAWLAVAVAIFTANTTGHNLADVFLQPGEWYSGNRLAMAYPAALCFVWPIVAWRSANRRPALWLSGILMATFALGATLQTLKPDPVDGSAWQTIDSATTGMLRLAGLGLLSWAIIRGGLLDGSGPASGPAASRPRRIGTALALVGLVAGLVLAQLLQVFLPDQTWVLGIGAAAAVGIGVPGGPLERVLRHRRDSIGKNEDIYRDVVRLALRDGKIEHDEERHLVVVASKLGVLPERAYAIRDEEEPIKPRKVRGKAGRA
jgi:hypothetical protein